MHLAIPQEIRQTPHERLKEACKQADLDLAIDVRDQLTYFSCVISVAKVVIGRASDTSRKATRDSAAQDALKRLEKSHWMFLDGPDGKELISASYVLDEEKARQLLNSRLGAPAGPNFAPGEEPEVVQEEDDEIIIEEPSVVGRANSATTSDSVPEEEDVVAELPVPKKPEPEVIDLD